jgi:uncharacterized protein YjbJ (UPF0337 family)
MIAGHETAAATCAGTIARASGCPCTRAKEVVMDWNRVEGNWKQVKGNVKERWGKLTDDDLNVINGRREQLEGKLQARYGYAKDQAARDINDWLDSMKV